HQRPGASGEMLQHENRDAAQRDADPEKVGYEIGLEELCAVGVSARGAHRQDHNAHDEKQPLHAVKLELWFAGVHLTSSMSLPRSGSGTSSSVARWLNCRARI